MMRLPLAALSLVALPLASCSNGGSSSSTPPAPPLVLAAGMDSVGPLDHIPRFPVDIRRLGISRVDQVYRLTTPADTPFCFDVLSRADSNAGSVWVSVAHAANNGVVPTKGPDSLAEVGCIPGATGIMRRDLWLDATGDGFARITLRGKIKSDQLLAFQTQAGGAATVALVQVVIGPESAINRAAAPGNNHPGVVQDKTLYSSNAWRFGLPTVAVSGDRTSVVVYEGDRSDETLPHRYEMRLQHDHEADKVTGGGSTEVSLDSGHWRDHEIAALFNVLALARCGTDKVNLKLSFDRGASFAQEVEFAWGSRSTRLVQVAMAADYSLALLFWRSTARGSNSELVLVEGRPSAVDSHGSPTWFGFDPPQTLHRTDGDATPLLTGATWSEGGDLVVGHASTILRTGRDRTWTSTTEFWSAVRPWGGEFTAVLLDKDILVGRDPSVAVVGKGFDLQVFYAYEGRQGVRLRVSSDAGATFSPAVTIGTPGAHTPTVFARSVAAEGDEGGTRVDVVYMTNGGAGNELHLTRWLHFGKSSPQDFRLTTAVIQPTAKAGGGGNRHTGPIYFGYRLTHVAWLGYDAVLDGDEIVVVYDEETYDAGFVFLNAWNWGGGGGLVPPNAAAAPNFRPVEPPPLAAGMTGPVPAPDPKHRHQLRLLRLK